MQEAKEAEGEFLPVVLPRASPMLLLYMDPHQTALPLPPWCKIAEIIVFVFVCPGMFGSWRSPLVDLVLHLLKGDTLFHLSTRAVLAVTRVANLLSVTHVLASSLLPPLMAVLSTAALSRERVAPDQLRPFTSAPSLRYFSPGASWSWAFLQRLFNQSSQPPPGVVGMAREFVYPPFLNQSALLLFPTVLTWATLSNFVPYIFFVLELWFWRLVWYLAKTLVMIIFLYWTV